jgi:hypothetical protein
MRIDARELPGNYGHFRRNHKPNLLHNAFVVLRVSRFDKIILWARRYFTSESRIGARAALAEPVNARFWNPKDLTL